MTRRYRYVGPPRSAPASPAWRPARGYRHVRHPRLGSRHRPASRPRWTGRRHVHHRHKRRPASGGPPLGACRLCRRRAGASGFRALSWNRNSRSHSDRGLEACNTLPGGRDARRDREDPIERKRVHDDPQLVASPLEANGPPGCAVLLRARPAPGGRPGSRAGPATTSRASPSNCRSRRTRVPTTPNGLPASSSGRDWVRDGRGVRRAGRRGEGGGTGAGGPWRLPRPGGPGLPTGQRWGRVRPAGSGRPGRP